MYIKNPMTIIQKMFIGYIVIILRNLSLVIP